MKTNAIPAVFLVLAFLFTLCATRPVGTRTGRVPRTFLGKAYRIRSETVPPCPRFIDPTPERVDAEKGTLQRALLPLPLVVNAVPARWVRVRSGTTRSGRGMGYSCCVGGGAVGTLEGVTTNDAHEP